jgi:hypothetical protein
MHIDGRHPDPERIIGTTRCTQGEVKNTHECAAVNMTTAIEQLIAQPQTRYRAIVLTEDRFKLKKIEIGDLKSEIFLRRI